MLKLTSAFGGALFVASIVLVHSIVLAQPAAAQPGGTYMRSCRHVEQEGPILHAYCENGRGRLEASSLDLRACRGPIANQNGRLVCAGGGSRGGAQLDEGRDPRISEPHRDRRF